MLRALAVGRCTREAIRYWKRLDHRWSAKFLIHNAHQRSITSSARREGFSPAISPDYSQPSDIDNLQNWSLPSQKELYWQKIPLWQNVSEAEFQSYRWQVANTVQGEKKLIRFLCSVLDEQISLNPSESKSENNFMSRDFFIQDVLEGVKAAPMAIRLTPHTLSVADWSKPFTDPIRRQFIPLKSTLMPDHPKLKLDPLGEERDSPVPGIVHRYPDKALFLAVSICPVYCRFCTRSYAIGADTESVTKAGNLKPTQKRWTACFDYIEQTPALADIVVSGGDSYYLSPDQLYAIGERLISIPHIRRFRFATKGLAVCPSRILDPNDAWSTALIALSELGRKHGKAVALHTHFNHPSEITWVTRLAAQKLFQAGVTVRNQSVLLRGVNDDVATMKKLIRDLADNNIIPYYVYQGDMVKGVEDLRTPLSTILNLESQIRGSVAGFMTPMFVVDLPGGGGKRLAASYESYNQETGTSTFVAPAVSQSEHKTYEYYDPIQTVEESRV